MVWNPISEEEFSRIAAGMEQAEQSGIFDLLFAGDCQETRQLPTKESLLSCISPEMRLYKSFFMKIYGYEISFPDFAETALSRLEAAGCSRAREYYHHFISEYKRQRDEELKPIAVDMEKKVNEDYEKKVKKVQKEGSGQWNGKYKMKSDYPEISKALGFNVLQKV